ncbi:MAG: hypothetical protein HC836_13880 [Richelia sp. RM2_1_2]|nr:hypothetical protein [Richelia sp. RM2_1_2]
MKINSQFNPNKIPECNDKLQEILEAYGVDVFCEAVTELFNYHPLTKPTTYSSKSWVVLMLPNDFEPDSIVGIDNLTLSGVYDK